MPPLSDFELVLNWFVYVLPPFMLQLAIMEGVFCRRLERKPMFWLRLAAGVLVCIGCLWLAAYGIVYAMAEDGILITPVYVVLFFLTVVVLQACFEEPFSALLFYGIAAYAIQNLAYRVYSILELFGVTWNLGLRVGYWTSYLGLWWGCFAVVAVLVWALFGRQMLEQDVEQLRGGGVYALSASTLIVTILLCSWTNAHAEESATLSLIVYLFSIFCCVFILCLQSGMLVTQGLRRDLDVVRQMWEQDRKQYEISRESIDIINVKCHDLRFRLQSLRTAEGEVSREELKEIESAINVYDSKITTGCEPLDTILTEKSLLCSRDEIRFTCMADGSKLSFISPADLYSLFGNIISNAVEAVRQVEDLEYRVITFEVRQVGDMLLVGCVNYFSGPLEFRDGVPVTSKGDKVNHGYGIKSIQMLVKKYGGDMDIDVQENVFSLKVLFPIASAGAGAGTKAGAGAAL